MVCPERQMYFGMLLTSRDGRVDGLTEMSTFVMRMQEDTGETPAQIAKAYTISREALDARELWAMIDALDLKVAESAQLEALAAIWHLLRNMTRWLLNRPGESLDIAAKVERYAEGVATLRGAMADVLPAEARAALVAEVGRWQGRGFPDEMAHALASLDHLGYALDIVEVAAGEPVLADRRVHVGFTDVPRLISRRSLRLRSRYPRRSQAR